MAILTVGSGQQYATIAGAVAAARSGDTIAVQAGTYTNDFAIINKSITIEGVGGMAKLVATVAPSNGKGILVANGNITLKNLEFAGAKVADQNGAGVRYEGGNLIVENSYFHHNQMGLLSNANAAGSITIRNSEFANNSGGTGYTHGLYVGVIGKLTVENSYFHDASNGHHIKSRALNNTIINNRIIDGATSTAGYSIDLPNGGNAEISGNLIHKGPETTNVSVISYGAEGGIHASSSLMISNNVVVNDLDTINARLLNNVAAITAQLSGNEVWGLGPDQIARGRAMISGTDYLDVRPPLDGEPVEPPSAILPPLTSTEPPVGRMIAGTTGADQLVSTAAADTLAGGLGNDVYIIDDDSDVVVELSGEGTDRVESAVSYLLGHHVEDLTLTGTASIDGTGNALANIIRGNAGANTLKGLDGSDKLYGNAGADRLDGGAGDDLLSGGPGGDTMAGGTGNDKYYVDTDIDVVSELAGAGTDSIISTISYVLGVNLENLTLTGASGVNGTGNAHHNMIKGTSAANLLKGLSGDDQLHGNGGADWLEGGDGNDVLWGGTGADTLTGGAGADRFDWNGASDAGVGSGRDRVLDFAQGSDRLDLSGIDANSSATGNQSFTFIAGNAFAGSAGELRFEHASSGGTVFTLVQGDVNGDKLADFEVALYSQHIHLQATDFLF